MKITIQNEMPLIEALALLSPDSSKSKLREWLKFGRVAVDGKIVKVASEAVTPGQEISIGKKELVLPEGLRILFEDCHLVVVDKPAGLLSVAKEDGRELSAHEILKNHYIQKRVYPVHRLDKATSGVMLFAISEEARGALKPMFERHEIGRVYHAIIEGQLQKKEGTWESYLYEDPNLVMRVTQDRSKGKRAVTHFCVLGNSRKHSLLELKLETGRKNQIRVHCTEAGHPVAGDVKYGAKGNPAKRLCLHAWKLTFTHPITGGLLSFESPVPAVFAKIVSVNDNA